MKLRWYTRQPGDEAEKGPFTKAMLANAVRSEELSGDTLVRREDKAEWSAIGNHPAFGAGRNPARRAGAATASSRADIENPAIDVKASPGLWLAAVTTFIVHAVIQVWEMPPRADGGRERVSEMVGTVIGPAVVLPFIVVFLASFWERHRTQRAWVKVFIFTSLWWIFMSHFLRAVQGPL